MEIVEMAQSRRALWRPRPRHFVILPLLPPRDQGTKWALYPNTLFPPSEQKWRNLHLCSQTVERIPNHSPGLHVPSRREQVDSAAGSHFAAQQKVEQQWLTTDTQVGPGVIMFYSEVRQPESGERVAICLLPSGPCRGQSMGRWSWSLPGSIQLLERESSLLLRDSGALHGGPHWEREDLPEWP